MTRLPLALLLFSCATPPEVVREPVPSVKDAGAESGGTTTPQYGALLVVFRAEDGEEYTILCGGEASITSSSGRKLMKLDRSEP